MHGQSTATPATYKNTSFCIASSFIDQLEHEMHRSCSNEGNAMSVVRVSRGWISSPGLTEVADGIVSFREL